MPSVEASAATLLTLSGAAHLLTTVRLLFRAMIGALIAFAYMRACANAITRTATNLRNGCQAQISEEDWLGLGEVSCGRHRGVRGGMISRRPSGYPGCGGIYRGAC